MDKKMLCVCMCVFSFYGFICNKMCRSLKYMHVPIEGRCSHFHTNLNTIQPQENVQGHARMMSLEINYMHAKTQHVLY